MGVEFLMSALLKNFSFIEHNNVVSILYSRKTMGDYDSCDISAWKIA